MGRRSPLIIGLLVLAVLAGPLAVVRAGGVEGHAARFELIKGRPEVGYKEVYETNLWVSPPNNSFVGPHRRLGNSCWNTTYNYCAMGLFEGNGCYCVDGLPPGNGYSVYVNQPLFFVAPSIARDVPVAPSGSTHLDINMGIDYSSYFFDNWILASNSVWYQTFVATSTGIRGIAFSFHDGAPTAVTATVLRDNGEPDVRNWTLVGQATDNTVKDGVNDNWVRFRYGEIPTIPRRRYAIQLTGSGGFSPYNHLNQPNSYANGTAYDINGVAQGYDLNVTVFNDSEATCVTLNQRVQNLASTLPNFYGTMGGQTFVANGTSLAAADVFVAGVPWDIDFTWQVYEGSDPTGPVGAQIGPTKVTKAGSQAGGGEWATAIHAVSYNPDEVPLVPGHKYFISFSAAQGFGPYPNNSSYDNGISYLWSGSGWEPHPELDMCMTILEHKAPQPVILCNPMVINRKIYLGDETSHVDGFTVTNSSAGTLHYTIEWAAPWMSISPASGTSSGQDDPITISYSTDSLPVGNYPCVVSISSPDAYESPQTVNVKLVIATVPPDFDHDTDVDMSDFGHLQMCFTGSGDPQTDTECQDAKLDPGDDVDEGDLAVFLGCLSGSGVRANPTCAPY